MHKGYLQIERRKAEAQRHVTRPRTTSPHPNTGPTTRQLLDKFNQLVNTPKK